MKRLIRRAAECGFAVLVATITLAGVARAFLILGAGSNSTATAPSTFVYLPNGSFVYLPNGSYVQVVGGDSDGGPTLCGVLNLAVNTACSSVSVPTVLQ